MRSVITTGICLFVLASVLPLAACSAPEPVPSPTVAPASTSAPAPTATPLPSATPSPVPAAASILPSPTPSPTSGPTATPVPSPTAVPPSPTPVPTDTPTLIPATVSPSPTPTSAKDAEFTAQRTRAAPTLAAAATLAPRLVNTSGSHKQWTLATNAASAQQRARNGLAGFRAATDRKGQQYTCAIYEDGSQVPRVNLVFRKDLTYTVVTNQFGERQGAIDAVTTIAGAVSPVEWYTWTSRVDRIRLRGDDAVRFVQEIDEQSADEFGLALQDDPDLSATYDVSNLLAAMVANGMTCFAGR